MMLLESAEPITVVLALHFHVFCSSPAASWSVSGGAPWILLPVGLLQGGQSGFEPLEGRLVRTAFVILKAISPEIMSDRLVFAPRSQKGSGGIRLQSGT